MYDDCTQVTAQCPVDATIYGYRPNLVANAIFLAVFGLLTICQTVLGIRYRMPVFGSVITAGCVAEAIGYAGRIMMHQNPWSTTGFEIQICCLILAPSFLAAGIYLTLKQSIVAIGPQYSRLPPRLYLWIFIACDIVSLVLQAVGGGIASSGTDNNNANIGSRIMLAGIAFQVATMTVCISLAIDFALAVRRNAPLSNPKHSTKDSSSLEADADETRPTSLSPSFKYHVACSALALLFIYIRCIYRLPEMARGWSNPIMRNEPEFLVFDGAMIAIASILLTIAHPGIFFPSMI